MGSIAGQSEAADTPGVQGEGKQSVGVRGISHAAFHAGVLGVNDNGGDQPGPGVFGTSRGTGVWGESQTWMGVFGKSASTKGGAGVMGEGIGSGVIGLSKTWHGTYGRSESTTGGAGVAGEQTAGTGVLGTSKSGTGLSGTSETGRGVVGVSKTATAVEGNSQSGAGLWGTSVSGIGVFGKGGRLAARFEGVVEVTEDIRIANADAAEEFDVAAGESVEPGTVMVLGEEGVLQRSSQAYDKRVAGVISGAGDYRPGIVLDRQPSERERRPVALVGKVFCKVDAQYGGIDVGDLLTTSPTPGHAMKASDPLQALGTIIGKALRPLAAGQGLIPILVALQ
jgi:hypothetical protein